MSSLQSPTTSAFRKVEFTDSHVQALNILSFNHVKYLAEEVLYCFGEFDSKARPIAYKVDILVNDADFGAGVIHIDGSIHDKLKVEKKDEKEDIRLRKLGLWVERIRNEDVASIMSVLEKHRRVRDAYS